VINTPTTTVAILGGTASESEWGDPVEGSEVIRSGLPCAIHEQRRIVAPEHTSAPMAVRFWTGYLPHGTAVSGAQRLRDERSGTVYLIDHVSTPAHPGRPQDVQLDLRTVQ
jgi:hypothetical protein